jgi:hypothetical protein
MSYRGKKGLTYLRFSVLLLVSKMSSPVPGGLSQGEGLSPPLSSRLLHSNMHVLICETIVCNSRIEYVLYQIKKAHFIGYYHMIHILWNR